MSAKHHCPKCGAVMLPVALCQDVYACPSCKSTEHRPPAASPDVHLSTGRIIRHTPMDNGAQFASPTTGPDEMTPHEWEEYCRKLQPRPADGVTTS